MTTALQENLERTAWVVLLTAFTIFCLLAIGIPRAAWWYISTSTVPLTGNITTVRGTLLAEIRHGEDSIAVAQGKSNPLEEETMLITDGSAEGILTLFDDSVVTLYNNSQLELSRMRQPRFAISRNPDQVHLVLRQGRLRATLPRADNTRTFSVDTPHGSVVLGQGSHAVEVQNSQTIVTTRVGQATVAANGQSVTLSESQLSSIPLDGPPSNPAPAEQNLLVNGDFSEPLAGTWQINRYAPTTTVTTTVQIVDSGARSMVEMTSQGQDGLHTEASIWQEINKDVQDFQSLRVRADVRVDHQSLPGGGSLGSEFPVRLQLSYKDANGNDREWYYGFFYQSPDPSFILYEQPDNNYQQVSQFLWTPYESENLLALLNGPEKPIFIKSFRVYASGWLYNIKVDDVELLAKD
jgi:hypothetical protein